MEVAWIMPRDPRLLDRTGGDTPPGAIANIERLLADAGDERARRAAVYSSRPTQSFSF